MDHDSIYKGILEYWRLIYTNPVTVCDHMPYKRRCITCSTELLSDRFRNARCSICNCYGRLIIEWFSIDKYAPICVECCYKIRTKQQF